MKKYKLLIFFCFILNIAFSQAPVKQHFVIHSTNPALNLDKFYFAVDNWGHIDDYRFIETRRTILFVDEGVSVELYSAKELLALYGKLIPPGTIKSTDNYKEISFAITLDGNGLKPQLLKYK